VNQNPLADVLIAAAPEATSEVIARPVRRRFTAEDKLRILQEADRCAPGELGALLRREGLYSSQLSKWRRQRQAGQLAGLKPKKRGRKVDAHAQELARLEREKARLQAQLERAELIIEAQKSCSCCSTRRSPKCPSRSDRAGGELGWAGRHDEGM
jgi:transposase-like protein